MKKSQLHPSSKVRVRFAPSPTGYLHVGGARTAFYNYLFARKHQGDFILRVEDTDQARSTEESIKSMIEDLKWLKLDWQEGPINTALEEQGEKGPYFQSQRTGIYQEYIQKLLKDGKAYYCFLTEEELDQQREEAKKKSLPFRPQSPYRDWTLEQALKEKESKPAAVRFKNDLGDKNYTFQDLVRGEVSLPASMIGDFVIGRSNGMPVYNFVCALDDALMEITHVFRAEEHLNNTLRQLMLIEALELPTPIYGHVSIMLGEDKQKLSKRHGAASVSEFKEEGYLPEALTNFIALMGWSSETGKEILTTDQMIQEFSSDRLNPASAVFDKEKLKWMNAQYLRALSPQEFWVRVADYLPAEWEFPADPNWQAKSFETLKSSMENFKDSKELYSMLRLGGELDLSEKAKEVLGWESTPRVIETWKSLLEEKEQEFLRAEDVDALVTAVKSQAEVKGKFLFMPIRVVSIGKAQGTEIKDLIPLIPRLELIKRASFLQRP